MNPAAVEETPGRPEEQRYSSPTASPSAQQGEKTGENLPDNSRHGLRPHAVNKLVSMGQEHGGTPKMLGEPKRVQPGRGTDRKRE